MHTAHSLFAKQRCVFWIPSSHTRFDCLSTLVSYDDHFKRVVCYIKCYLEDSFVFRSRVFDSLSRRLLQNKLFETT